MAASAAQESLKLLAERLSAHSPMTEHECQALIALPFRAVALAPHQSLDRTGEATSLAWLIVDGLVGRVAETDGGLRQIQELFVPGEIANLAAMMLPARRCGLESVTRSRVIGVPHAALRAIGGDNPAIAVALAREALLAKEILVQWLLNVGRRDARSRVIYFLCEMAVRYHVARRGDGADFLLPMTQEQLGEALSLTPVHINRTLRALREEGLVTMTRHQVSIPDWKALARVGAFDPGYLDLAMIDGGFKAVPSPHPIGTA